MSSGYFSKFKFAKWCKANRRNLKDYEWAETVDGRPVNEDGEIINTGLYSSPDWEIKNKPKRAKGDSK